MPRMNELIGHNLRWEQPSANRLEYELRAGDVGLGRLHFPSSFKNIANASNADGEWTFDRPGFWQRRVLVMDRSGRELAAFEPNFWRGGGLLILPDGRQWPTSSNFWATQYHLFDENQEHLLAYTGIGGFFHASCDLTIHPICRDLPELPWLVPFGWYVIMMNRRDSAAAAAAA